MSDATDLAPGHLTRLVASELIDLADDGIALLDEGGTLLLVNRRLGSLFGYGADELVGRAVEMLVPGCPGSAPGGCRAWPPAEHGSRTPGGADRRTGLVLSGRRKDGAEVPVEVSLTPMRVDRQTLVLAAVRDVTERLALEGQERDVPGVLDAVQDALVVFDHETLRITYVNDGAVRQLGYTKDELLRLTQLRITPRLSETEYRRLVDGLAPGESTSFVTVHRRKEGTDVDVEVTLQRPPPGSSIGGGRLLVSVARDLSERVAREHRLRATEREVAVLEDRQRIARDLHDRVIQRLFAAGLAASAISRRVTDPIVADRIAQVVTELDGTIVDLRSSIFELAPSASRDPLARRVLDLCAAECQHLGIRSNVWFSGPVESVDPLRGEELLVVLREALSNVVRHAHASSVDIGVVVDGGVTLRVEDDGIGLPSANGCAGHPRRGLENMAVRARNLGGSFEAVPGSHAGTRLEWRVPGT